MATTTAAATAPLASPTTPTTTNATTDDFDSLLTLEDQFYNQGYSQGMADGLAAGRAEGRQLGLERGFQKFVESGRLQGRAIVWANRLRMSAQAKKEEGANEGKVQRQRQRPRQRRSSSPGSSSSAAAAAGEPAVVGGERTPEEQACRPSEGTRRVLPPLPENPRLAKHVTTLYALVEAESLSSENSDEAVDDFDDRLRRAQGRFKVIERMVGEGEDGRQKGDRQGGEGHDLGPGSGKAHAVDV